MANAVLGFEDLFGLVVDFFNLAQEHVLAIQVGRKDDPVFIDRPGVDVVDVDDPVNSEQVLFDLVVVEAGADCIRMLKVWRMMGMAS